MKCKTCGTEFNSKFCPGCGAVAESEDVGSSQTVAQTTAKAVLPVKQPKVKKPIYKKWWFWLIIVLVIFGTVGTRNEKSDKPSSVNGKDSSSSNVQKVEITVVDFGTMELSAINEWAANNNVACEIKDEYSDTISAGTLISQSVKANDIIHEGDKIELVFSLGKEPSTEYKNALKKAKSYSDTMHMSKEGIYQQLISEFGEKFPADAAQYAVDNVKADWNENALKKAKSYSETMFMSKQGIYEQLTSEFGEKFTAEEAQYAVDTIDADWNKNALEKAKSYQTSMSMSNSAIYDQLVSAYGKKFTAEEAQYAIDNLDA